MLFKSIFYFYLSINFPFSPLNIKHVIPFKDRKLHLNGFQLFVYHDLQTLSQWFRTDFETIPVIFGMQPERDGAMAAIVCDLTRHRPPPQDDLRQSHMFTLNYRWALNKDMCNCCWYKWLFFSHPMPSRYQTQIEDPNEAETRIKWNLCCVYKSAWRREKKTHTHTPR